jgi:uncharacterized repeat protein (TIGR01451 family)
MRSKIIAFGLILACFFSLTVGVISALPDLDAGDWNYYREITIKDNSGTILSNYQVLIALQSANFDFAKAKSDGSDIRFTDAGGSELNYWIEDWNAVKRTAKVWVNVPFIPANGESTITMYYGNENASSVSDGVATFVWFDEYESQNLGVTPTGWKLTTPIVGSFTVTDEKKKSGTRSVKYVDDSTSRSPFPYTIFPAQTNNFIFEMDYLVKDVYADISPYISDSYTQCNSGANILFLNNSEMQYWDGGRYHYIQQYNFDHWYSIRYDIDFSNGRVDIWVDGTKKIDDGRLIGTPNVMDRFYIECGNPLGTSTAYVDNPRIRKYASPEPTISISAELPAQKAQALILTKSASPSTIQEGEATTIAIKVENTGLEDAKAVEVTDKIPTGFEITEGLNSASFEEIKPGDYRIFEYTLNATGSGKFTCDPATATYKDADGTFYSAVSNSVSIQVGGEVPGGADSDGDGWSDAKEREIGTNPYNVDSDADGLNDPEDPNPTVPEQKTSIPGFEAIFALGGVVSVAYWVLKRKG